jgi:hypothetical protein
MKSNPRKLPSTTQQEWRLINVFTQTIINGYTVEGASMVMHVDVDGE